MFYGLHSCRGFQSNPCTRFCLDFSALSVRCLSVIISAKECFAAAVNELLHLLKESTHIHTQPNTRTSTGTHNTQTRIKNCTGAWARVPGLQPPEFKITCWGEQTHMPGQGPHPSCRPAQASWQCPDARGEPPSRPPGILWCCLPVYYKSSARICEARSCFQHTCNRACISCEAAMRARGSF